MANTLHTNNQKMTTISETDDVFAVGNLQVSTLTVKTSDPSKPPVDIFVITPTSPGTYPLCLFCHGFLISPTSYTTLLRHIASHGYIVVSPQIYGITSILFNQIEIKNANEVLGWISTGLPSILPNNILGDIDNFALIGHSRGGKTAFALALNQINKNPNKHKPSSATVPGLKVVIGIDPVAGNSPSTRTSPKILQYIPQSFDISIPVAVIGTGYANQPLGVFPATAPNGVNHSEFFNESQPPKAYFLAKEYGHCDLLDEGLARKMSFICKSGKGPRDDMRKCVGGIVVAFLKAYVGGTNKDALIDIVNHSKNTPILLDPIIYVQ